MKRIPQLDGVRGVAILLVIAWHYLPCLIVAEPYTVLDRFKRCLSLTWSGVDLFFVLSGFLIAGILIDHRDAANYFRVFYVRRVCRIFPLYFLLLLLFVCHFTIPALRSHSFQWLFHNPLPLWSYATFTQNIHMGLRGDFGPHWLAITWSLAVEEQFYLFVPLLIYFCRRTSALYLLVIAIMMAPFLRYARPGFHTFVNTPWRADSILSGACLAFLVRSPAFMNAVQKHYRFLIAIFILLIAGAAAMTWRSSVFGAFNHCWLAALYSAFVLIPFVNSDGMLGRILQTRLLVWFGTLSYGIYMFHQGANGLLHGLFFGGEPKVETRLEVAVTGLAFCLTLALAALSHHFLESPFLSIGRRFSYIRTPLIMASEGNEAHAKGLASHRGATL
jgi:peptidoglycan/LPS O-acetylase OafA/YrhL